MPAPLLTVAIPTCNGARHLPDALRSILAQDGADFHLIVSDDRSDDETPEIARRFAGDRACTDTNPERLGLAGNWNRCIERSRTAWVAVFHQDDLMRPGHLARHLEVIRSAVTPPALIAGPAEPIDEQGRPVPPAIVEPGGLRAVRSDPDGPGWTLLGPGEALPELAVANPLRCSAVTIRRAAHAALGGFDPSYRYAVDWDFWLRLARAWPIAWLSGPPTVAFRWHLASETHRFKTGTADLVEQERLLAGLYARDGASLPDAPALRRAADRRLSRAYLNRAYDAARSGDRRLSARCLRRAVRLWPGIAGRLLADPRLAARLVLGRA